MKRSLALVGGLVIVAATLALGLTACGTTGVASAQSQPANISINSNQQGISVSGEGKVTVTPDIALLDVGVTAQASTVAQAQSQAADAMSKVVSALTSSGIAQKDIQTQYFSIEQINSSVVVPPVPPDTSGGAAGGTAAPMIPAKPIPPAKGYQVSNAVSVKIRSIDKTGSIVDAVAAAGGDLVRINGVIFSVDQPDQYYAQARELAMNDAKSKADQLAKLAGVTLGKATYILEGSSSPVPYLQAFAGGAAVPSAATPISPGQTDLVVDVQVTYAIQ